MSYKELLQQLLSQFPKYFAQQTTSYSVKISDLSGVSDPMSYQEIEKELRLRNRFDYYRVFESYDIEFLTSQEQEFIEYIYVRRNSYVHNAGRPDKKTLQKLSEIPKPYEEYMVSTGAKRLRTKLGRLVSKSHSRIIDALNEHVSSSQ